jgi:SAM-dependent methyltransferase
MLLEAPGWLGLRAGQLVLDAGRRDGRYAIVLAECYGCRVVGVDLVPSGLPKGGPSTPAKGAAERVALMRGDLEALPLAGGSCDLVWCRDTMSCLGDCARALRECAREPVVDVEPATDPLTRMSCVRRRSVSRARISPTATPEQHVSRWRATLLPGWQRARSARPLTTTPAVERRDH